ncbi:MAG: hypothetical protein Q8K99_10325 [Actinomycetota bacterium]|nr:hypothetical protein [Actinomycetota bacterium]
MKYSRFEALVLVVGVGAVAGSILFSFDGVPVAEEVFAQVLLLGVLLGAVHWGRSGGSLAALAAAALYIVMRLPLVLSAQGLSLDIATLVIVRILTYGLIGIVGGELCTRIKYIFARLERSSSIDDWSQVYNQRFILRTLTAAGGQYARYDTPYTVVLIKVAPAIMDGLRVSKQRSLVRGIASHIRGDIRLVDEAGRLEDGTFIAVLPHTPKAGGAVVAERLRAGVMRVLGAREESVTATLLGAPEDSQELDVLRESLGSGEPSQASASFS